VFAFTTWALTGWMASSDRSSILKAITHRRGDPKDIDMERRGECLSNGVWRRDHPRTRLVVLHLWDGRCGHCGTPLLTSEELPSITEAPYEVDHAVPSSVGGDDDVANYIAACWSCNNKRRAKALTDSHVLAGLDVVREFVGHDDIDMFVDRVCQVDTAIQNHAYFSMVLCFEHGWHINDSPFQRDCFGRCQRRFEGPLNPEWWSRFGLLSHHVRLIVGENLYIRRILRGYDWWTEALGWEMTLPRYCHSPFDIIDVLSSVDEFGARPTTDPAPEYIFGASHRLSPTNQRRALRQSERLSVTNMLAIADFVENGITSPALLRLWNIKHWPTYLLFSYPHAVSRIQARRQLRTHLTALRRLDSRLEAEDYLRELDDM
jgi:5-methylcytosine-specific restriction endonuclease McrA